VGKGERLGWRTDSTGTERKASKMIDKGTIQELQRLFAGQRVPGGCEDCDAEVEHVQGEQGLYGEPGFHHLFVYHDDDCPFLIAWKRRHGRD